ncbi:MAG: hypothetical protein WCQ41_10040 [Bacillota bacterium]
MAVHLLTGGMNGENNKQWFEAKEKISKMYKENKCILTQSNINEIMS